jgi:hypothetical protein
VRDERAGLLDGAAALRLLRSWRSMIVSENRTPLFRIMLGRSCYRLVMEIRDATHDIFRRVRSVGGGGER